MIGHRVRSRNIPLHRSIQSSAHLLRTHPEHGAAGLTRRAAHGGGAGTEGDAKTAARPREAAAPKRATGIVKLVASVAGAPSRVRARMTSRCGIASVRQS